MITNRLIGIDPGTEYCGVTLVEYSMDGGVISISPRTINTNHVHLPYADDRVLLHGERYSRLKKLSHAFEKILGSFRPDTIACEAPFYHRLHPTAFAPLVETVFVLRNTSMEFDPGIPFLLYPPRLVKKTSAGDSYANKPAMKKAMQARKDVIDHIDTPIDSLSEHAIDSIAVAMTHLDILRKEHNHATGD
jgi:Holliday junction resolvasome RuvABC endonuclease subunit